MQPGTVAPDPDFMDAGRKSLGIIFPGGFQLIYADLIPGDLSQYPAVFRLFFQQFEIDLKRFFLMSAGC